MGCWNHSCFVTGLPIYAGEEVEVIMLISTPGTDISSHCYPTSYHTPVPLTFHGQYNDYGAAENCEGIALPVLIDAVRNRLFEMEVGENKYHDIPAKKDEFDVTKMFELDHENRLMITNQPMQFDMRESLPMKHIVVRKHVYDSIVESYKLEYWDREDSSTKYKVLKDLQKEYDLFLQDIDLIIDEHKDCNALLKYLLRSKIGNTSVAGLVSFEGMSTFGFNELVTPNEIVIDMHTAGAENTKKFLDNAIRFALFSLFISNARRSWCVPSGAGSQNDSTSSQVLAAELTISEAEKLKHQWDDFE